MKRTHFRKRITAIFVSSCMMMLLMPVGVFAAAATYSVTLDVKNDGNADIKSGYY